MGKELKRQRQQPILTTIGKKQIISSGRWNDIVIADYILANGKRTIEVSELAKIAYGHNSNDTKEKVRRYLHKIFTMLVDRGAFMVREHEPPHGRVIAVRLDTGSAADRQHIQEHLDRMLHRREWSIERYERAKMLLEVGRPT